MCGRMHQRLLVVRQVRIEVHGGVDRAVEACLPMVQHDHMDLINTASSVMITNRDLLEHVVVIRILDVH